MKKSIIAFSIAALVFTASPAFAGNRGNESDAGKADFYKSERKQDQIKLLDRKLEKYNDDDNRSAFLIRGTIVSLSGNTLVVASTKLSGNIPNVTNGQITMTLASDARLKDSNKNQLTLADLTVGKSVMVSGTINGTVLTANTVMVEGVHQNRFMVKGTVASVGTGSLVVTATKSENVPNMTNNQATVVVNASTKITGDKNDNFTLSNIMAGDQVIVHGTVTGTTLTATNINLKSVKKVAYGKVTAKTDTSVTITNTVTGTSQTVPVSTDTKVTINGETKTATDIAVGDSGWVKFKTRAGVIVTKIINLFR